MERSDPGAGRREAPGYFAAWRRAAGKRGLGGMGRTLKVQVQELEGVEGEAPDFGGELLKYHYGVRYEGLPRDERREKRLENQIREWEE